MSVTFNVTENKAMKKLLLIMLLASAANSAESQDITKGSFISIHALTDITLEPDITMDAFREFYIKEVIPVYEQSIPEIQLFWMEAIRGDRNGTIGILWIADSHSDRDKYHNPDGSYTAAGMVAREKIQVVLDKLNDMATFTETYTDWVVH